MCLSVSASTFLIDAGTSARPASGDWAHSWCCLSEGKQFIKDLQNEMPSGVLQKTRLFYANFQLTSTASWSWKVKKNSNAKIKKKRKRNVEVLLQLRKKLIRIVHGCRYSVASDKWADCSTVLISMRAVIESAKFEKKKSKKDTMQQGRNAITAPNSYYRGAKKCYYSYYSCKVLLYLIRILSAIYSHSSDYSSYFAIFYRLLVNNLLLNSE